MKEARIERAGCFKYEPVSGAKANDLGLPQVPDEVKQERWERFMEAQQEISAEIFQGKVGREIDVLVDEIDEENDEAIARSPWDAPEIDGNVFLPGETGPQARRHGPCTDRRGGGVRSGRRAGLDLSLG